jgi:hypothetical protein
MPAADLQLRACIEDPFIILGQRLLPLRLGHVELLTRLELDLIVTKAQLALAVLICSNPPAKFETQFHRRRLSNLIWLWRLNHQKWDLLEKVKLFREYLDYHLSRPEIHLAGKRRREIEENVSRIPFHQQLRTVLISRLNYDPATVMDVTMQRALWDYYTWAELEGHISVMPQTADEVQKALDALDSEELLARVNKK